MRTSTQGSGGAGPALPLSGRRNARLRSPPAFTAMVDARFSTLAALASLAVAVLSAAAAAWAVAIVFAVLAAGFAVRALQGYRRRGP